VDKDSLRTLAALIAGLVAGFVMPGIVVVPTVVVVLLMSFDAVRDRLMGLYGDRTEKAVLGLIWYGLLLFIGTAVGSVIGIVVRYPIVLLYAFWLYALLAVGFAISRCCLGWHVGAAAAVLTSFLAVGVFIQNFFVPAPEWGVLALVALGLGWGADSWRRANGLAINE